MEIVEQIKQAGIIPVIVLEDAKEAVTLAEALYKGGLRCIEMTFRTEAAAEGIRRITEQYPDMVVGAGTILSIEQAEAAVQAGAQFIVSPGSNPNVIQYCIQNQICIIPGVMTPSEIEKNIEMGIQVMKFFPAEPAGGVPMIKALVAPYRTVRFMPTGGLNPQNVQDYLQLEQVIACGGSWMVSKKMLENKQYDKIAELSKEATEIVRRVRG